MESKAYNPLLQVTSDDVKSLRDAIGIKDLQTYNESLSTLEDWVKKQDHLAEASKYISRDYLERAFIMSKGSIELTKEKIDKILTYRGLMPELSLHLSIKEFERFLRSVIYVPLPKLFRAEQSRVIVVQFRSNNLDGTLLDFTRFGVLSGEYRMHHDYCVGLRFIIDLANVELFNLLGKINPFVLKKGEILTTKGYGARIKGIHIINAPPSVDKFVSLIKQVLSEKVASRLNVHDSYKDLYKHIPREILPEEYGGDEISCNKLQDQWTELFSTEDALKLIRDADKRVSDESKRQSSCKFSQEYLGTPGSFKQLNVD